MVNVVFVYCWGLYYGDEGERASRRYRSTSPVRRTDRVFDCGERWVRVDGRVCGLMYISCYCTAREDGCGFMGGLSIWILADLVR